MPAGRPKGAKNKRPRGEEFGASARLKYVVPYDLDKNEKLDPMALLEEVMQHFYRKAKIECRSRQAGQTTFQHSYGMQHFYRKAKIECRSRQAVQTTFQHSYGRRGKLVSPTVLCERRRCLLPTAIRQVEPFLSEVQQVGFVIGT
jgi:hypothetical protein